MSQISVLAGIIQGEARNPNDQFGVASTIYNRTIGASGYTGPGYGQSAFDAATARGQFSAYPNAMQTPTPYATQLATALVNGNLSDYGNTGNATYYNAPNYNAAYSSGVGNSYGAGTNQYSDAYNSPPSSNFVLPQAGAASSTGGSGGTDAFGPMSVGPDTSGTFQPSTTSGMESSVAGSDSLTGLGHLSPAYDPNGVGYNALTTGMNGATTAPDLSASGGVPSNLNYGDFTTQPMGITAPTADAGQAGQGGVPVNITDLSNLPKAVTEAGKAVGSGETSLSQGVQSAASNLGQTAVSAGTGFVARSGFILAGLVILAGAFVFFYAERKTS